MGNFEKLKPSDITPSYVAEAEPVQATITIIDQNGKQDCMQLNPKWVAALFKRIRQGGSSEMSLNAAVSDTGSDPAWKGWLEGAYGVYPSKQNNGARSTADLPTARFKRGACPAHVKGGVNGWDFSKADHNGVLTVRGQGVIDALKTAGAELVKEGV